MKYVSLDLETTGVKVKSPDRILQISMIVEDTDKPDVPVEDLPHFTCFIKQAEIVGEPYGLAMNAWILDIISGRKENTTEYPVYYPKEWIPKAKAFLAEHFEGGRSGKIKFAGKNAASFDIQFMPEGIKDRISHRVIDPTSMFIDWASDNPVPCLENIKEKIGMKSEVAHDAREDALDIIRVLRTTYPRS